MQIVFHRRKNVRFSENHLKSHILIAFLYFLRFVDAIVYSLAWDHTFIQATRVMQVNWNVMNIFDETNISSVLINIQIVLFAI